MFWAGAGFSILVGLIRMCFPESRQFIEAKKAGHKSVTPGAFWAETKAMMIKEWRKFISPPFAAESLSQPDRVLLPAFPFGHSHSSLSSSTTLYTIKYAYRS
jgi:hypothetical protein